MQKLEHIIFYNLDKSIKVYRQFVQKRLNDTGFEITVDQWLVLATLIEKPNSNQQEIAEKVFKDAASVTRIINLLIKKKYINRQRNKADKRQSDLHITARGRRMLASLQNLIKQNRVIALHAISTNDLAITQQTLLKIVENCSQNL